MDRLQDNIKLFADRMNSLAGIMIVMIMVVQLIVVVLRYVFSVGVSWGLDLLVYMYFGASLLPMVLVILLNKNVRVDVFYQSYWPNKKALFDRFGLFVLMFPVCAYTAFVSWPPMINSWQLLEASPTMGGLPGYFILKTLQFFIFLALALISFLLALKSHPWSYDE